MAERSSRRSRRNSGRRSRKADIARGTSILAFGQLAVEKGLVDEAQLEEALREQEELRKTGTSLRLGQILRNRGHLTEGDIEDLFELQGRLGGHTEIEGYELEAEIGKGSMGTIYKARQVSMDRPVALKILFPKLASDEDYVRRFLRESKLAAKLRHENIVFVLDAGVSNGVHYYVMEYVEGRTTKEILARRTMMQEKEVLRLALHMALALEHAHANGVLHRDIKPSNIIVSKEDRVPKLCDFGLAKDIAFDPKATRAGVVLGTPHYISPEQIRGAANDIRSDIYSLGATLYHCLCGEAPFASDGAATVMIKHLTEPPEPVRSKRAEVSERTARIIEKMLEKEPEGRFQTPEELRHALEPLLYGGGDAPPEPPLPAKKTVKRRRHRR